MPERADCREQQFLLPPSLDDWTPRDHPVRFVEAFVASLPAGARRDLGIEQAANTLGAPRYAPVVLARVWVYGFMSGVRSARALERGCRDQIPLRWLTGNQCPDHNTLWRWYARHRSAMHTLFKESVMTALEAGLVDLALMAVDGTKVLANASADRSLTAEQLEVLLAKTERAIVELEAQNVAGDEPPPPTLPQALRTAEALRARVRAAMERCAERADATGRSASVAAPRGNVTDPDARWMQTRRGILPGYNAQAAVVATNARAQAILGRSAASGRIVVAADVSTQPTDVTHLAPMVAQAIDQIGASPAVTVADAGYFDGANLAAVAALGATVVVAEASDEAATNPYHRAAFTYDAETDRLRCPREHWLVFTGVGATAAGVPTRRYGGIGKTCRACAAFGTCTTNTRDGRIVTLTDHDEVIQAQRRTRAFAANMIIQRRRKTLIEGVFGTIKTTLGGRQGSVRGREKVSAAWHSLVLGINLRTLCRVWQALPETRRGEVVRPRATR